MLSLLNYLKKLGGYYIMAKFFSKCSNQVITITPTRSVLQSGIPYKIEGARIAFENSNYETNDEEIIEFIRSHSLFGRAILELDEDVKVVKEKKTKEETKTEQ